MKNENLKKMLEAARQSASPPSITTSEKSKPPSTKGIIQQLSKDFIRLETQKSNSVLPAHSNITR